MLIARSKQYWRLLKRQQHPTKLEEEPRGNDDTVHHDIQIRDMDIQQVDFWKSTEF